MQIYTRIEFVILLMDSDICVNLLWLYKAYLKKKKVLFSIYYEIMLLYSNRDAHTLNFRIFCLRRYARVECSKWNSIKEILRAYIIVSR